MKNYFLLIIIIGFASCQSEIKQEDLIGKWKYIKYEAVNKPSDVSSSDLIDEQQPYIVFQKEGKAEIYSSGKILSKGTFFIENQIIRYEEVLEGNVKRKIAFLIKELNQNQLVFETMDAEPKRITAEKIK
ncbi:hypothetical protein [Pedobacter cryophilus]|uniref:Lipocalin-like domain-containing protein n=1 Tax=Pedobacter cryophilus TaxID=2571271 RepID=A0A4U1BZK0_9SPHI|nr:hypothetical protein [Pedobacter cryophilus]TKB98708.1 hypothetical protein FA046_06215 [Pedobacter cryophilus]